MDPPSFLEPARTALRGADRGPSSRLRADRRRVNRRGVRARRDKSLQSSASFQVSSRISFFLGAAELSRTHLALQPSLGQSPVAQNRVG
jgi:hypothetical protein